MKPALWIASSYGYFLSICTLPLILWRGGIEIVKEIETNTNYLILYDYHLPLLQLRSDHSRNENQHQVQHKQHNNSRSVKHIRLLRNSNMRSYIYTYKARSLIHSKPRNTKKKKYENENPYDAYNILALLQSSL